MPIAPVSEPHTTETIFPLTRSCGELYVREPSKFGWILLKCIVSGTFTQTFPADASKHETKVNNINKTFIRPPIQSCIVGLTAESILLYRDYMMELFIVRKGDIKFEIYPEVTL